MKVIRQMLESDQAAVEHLATSTGMFPTGAWSGPDLSNLQNDQHWIVCESGDGKVIGAAYFGPEQVSENLWNTYFLAVDSELHGRGIGRIIMNHIENVAKQSGIHTLIVETSSTDSFEQARNFYQAIGYVREAEIRDYYGAGDNKVVYWKSLVR